MHVVTLGQPPDRVGLSRDGDGRFGERPEAWCSRQRHVRKGRGLPVHWGVRGAPAALSEEERRAPGRRELRRRRRVKPPEKLEQTSRRGVETGRTCVGRRSCEQVRRLRAQGSGERAGCCRGCGVTAAGVRRKYAEVLVSPGPGEEAGVDPDVDLLVHGGLFPEAGSRWMPASSAFFFFFVC